MIEIILNEIGFEREEASAYLLLLETGPSTAGNFSKKYGKARTTTYDLLHRLHDKGLVRRSEEKGVQIFSPENPEKIQSLFKKKKESLTQQENSFLNYLPDLQNKIALHNLAPKFHYFEGVDGVQQALLDILNYRDISCSLLWPGKEMMAIMPPEFWRDHNKQRVRQNIYYRALWPQVNIAQVDNYPFLGIGDTFKRKIKIAPPFVETTMGFWIYQNKVLFCSSMKECSAFLIVSSEVANLQKNIFEAIWKISKVLQVPNEKSKQMAKIFSDDLNGL